MAIRRQERYRLLHGRHRQHQRRLPGIHAVHTLHVSPRKRTPHPHIHHPAAPMVLQTPRHPPQPTAIPAHKGLDHKPPRRQRDNSRPRRQLPNTSNACDRRERHHHNPTTTSTCPTCLHGHPNSTADINHSYHTKTSPGKNTDTNPILSPP